MFAGSCRIITLGFKTGGTPGYGLQRVLVDQFGTERCVLKPSDRKSLHSDRVVLRPGPPKAVKMVQQVYRWFVLERKSELEIARELNERKILNEFGRPWRMLAIRRLLTDEKYLGNYVYNRKSGKLKTPRRPNPENTWVRCNGGSYRGPHVEILQCTTPMRKDTRTRFGFVRRDPGHQRAADSAWRASGRTVNCVGEWHTHPEDYPRPSNVDRNTWAEQMRKRQHDALIFLIAGRATFYCDLGQNNRLMNMTVVG